MSSDDTDTNSAVGVVMLKVFNSLKAKLGARYKGVKPGEGYIAPEAIAEADELILQLCETSPETISGHLEKIVAAWEQMRALPDSPERKAFSDEIFILAHEIKDVGAMCGQNLAASFAESLRDYIARTELTLKAQQVIIQAHVDALQVVCKKGIRGESDPAAEQLKAMVKVAIDKYK